MLKMINNWISNYELIVQEKELYNLNKFYNDKYKII